MQHDGAMLNVCLKKIMDGKFDEAIAGLSLLREDENAQMLSSLAAMLSELNKYTAELSKGNLSAPFPDRRNFLSMGVKNLHSKLNHLVWQLKQVADGDFEQIIDYMGELSDGFNWMTDQLRQRQEQTEYERTHDKLTGLLNRTAFMRRVFDILTAVPNRSGVMISCGLDNIKYINDTLGYDIGDKCIKAAGKIFHDFGEYNCIAARTSGDEFAVYLHGQCEDDELMAFAERIIDLFFKRSEISIDEKLYKIRASYGVAFYPFDAKSVDTLFKYATYAMFEVKNYSRGGLLRFNSESYLQKASLFEKQEKLDCLIEEKLIRFAFQPIVDVREGVIFGYEALMRSTIDDFSSPLEILRLAEAQSKLPQLEQLTFEMIFDWLERNAESLGGGKIFFNTITSHFLSEQRMSALHPNADEICRHIVFEVLESAAEESAFSEEIASFRKMFSCLVAIDDYGCGYSNDFRLISLTPDIVKIDRFFIRDIHKNRDKQHLLSNILSFCESKGISTLAEGVESFEEFEKVMEMGFRYVQGFYFAKPEFTLNGIDAAAERSMHMLGSTHAKSG